MRAAIARRGHPVVEDVAELSGAESRFDPSADFVMGHEYSAEVLELVGFSDSYGGAYADRMRLTAGLCLKVPNGLDAWRRVGGAKPRRSRASSWSASAWRPTTCCRSSAS